MNAYKNETILKKTHNKHGSKNTQFIKNNKLYDTNTAKKLACASEYIRMPAGEANIFKNHNLFKKKTGEFFLFHTTYKFNNYGHQTQSGEPSITPLTLEEAIKWSEKHLPTNTYQTIFGPVSE